MTAGEDKRPPPDGARSGAVTEIIRQVARRLTGADGVTFALKDGTDCYYADEDAIAQLWKGRRFPMSACISGWVMTHGEAVAITDIYQDPRIPSRRDIEVVVGRSGNKATLTVRDTGIGIAPEFFSRVTDAPLLPSDADGEHAFPGASSARLLASAARATPPAH